MGNSIEELREEINGIDEQLADIFSRRMCISREIASLKRSQHIPLRDTEREKDIVNRLSSMVDPDIEIYLRMLYSAMLSISRSYQNKYLTNPSQLSLAISNAVYQRPRPFPRKAVVACQGSEGNFSQFACDKLFDMATVIHFKTYDAVFRSLESDMCEFAVLPIENSSEGSISAVYDLLEKYSCYIVKSTYLKINHTLLAPKGVRMDDIKEIITQDMTTTQCSLFLDDHNDIKITTCASTDTPAEIVARSGRTDIAAIASESCAEIYDLSVINYHIQNSDSRTRYICISKKLEIFPGANKTSLVLSLPNKPGALYNVIARLNSFGINMTKLESKLAYGRENEYTFYFDIDASIYSEDLSFLICELEQEVGYLQYLGSYIEAP